MSRKLRALIVDDDRDVRVLVSVSLMDGPIEVVGEAADGQEAVELALVLKPDLVVMDLMMPIMDGAEATMIIKKQLPETSVVGFSAAEPEGAERLIRAGATGVFSKETLQEMLNALEEFSKTR